MEKKETKARKGGRPSKAGPLRNVALSLKVTEEEKDLLVAVSEAMHERSGTQTIVRLLLEKAKEIGIELPKKATE